MLCFVLQIIQLYFLHFAEFFENIKACFELIYKGFYFRKQYNWDKRSLSEYYL